MNINHGVSFNKQVSFGGYKKVLNDYGEDRFKFYLPYDSDKYIATVEIYNAEKDKNGAFKVDDTKPFTSVALDENGEAPLFDAESAFDDINQFAYRYKLTPKDGGKAVYAFDPGTVTNLKRYENGNYNTDDNSSDNKFNIVIKDRSGISKGGKMQLVMLDEYNPGYIRNENGDITFNEALKAKSLASVRTHINKLGGNIVGFIKKLDELADQGYKRIVGMPFTKDTVSSHLYWTQNAYQVAPQLGSLEDFKEMQTEMFKRDMNWVSDAALVNEGLQGVHFQNVLKWGKDSPFYNWFKINGLDNGVLSMGVLPKNSDMVRYKIVNSTFNITPDNKLVRNEAYDSSAPTYIQLYDDRLASEEQKIDNKLIETYDKNNTPHTFDITGHDDTVYPYYFEVHPDVLASNIKKFQKRAGKDADLQTPDAIKEIMQFENFKIDQKAEGGFVAWDGNVDIAKLRFTYGSRDDKALSSKGLSKAEKQEALNDIQDSVLAVQDYAIDSGKYWTKIADDAATSYTADLLKDTPENPKAYLNRIVKEAKKGNLPKSAIEAMTPEVISNVLSGDYKSKLLDNNLDTADEFITRTMMNVPLETLPVNHDLAGILTSSYIAKRAHTKEERGVDRFDIFSQGNPNLPQKYAKVYKEADSLYVNELKDFTKDILSKLDLDLFDDDMLTDLGTYVMNQIGPEITQFALLKALDPDINILMHKGKIDFSKIHPEKLSLASIGIKGTSPEEEAKLLVKHLKEGVALISADDKEKLVKTLNQKLQGANEASYRIAEALVDRTESGMGWRIDAAKDVGEIDGIREGQDAADEVWETVIDFWKSYNENVRNINPHVYTAAEITDMASLFGNGKGRFIGPEDAETKFLQETGITTVANYSYFFSAIPGIFALSAEHGRDENLGKISVLRDKLIKGWNANPGFMYQTPLDGVLHSYTFVDNHDKPRILHGLVLDMSLFFSTFDKEEHRLKAAEILQKNPSEINYDKVSGPAIAMGARLKDGFAEVIKDKNSLKIINEAIATIAGGEFDGRKFDADAFGARPFNLTIAEVIEEAQRNGLSVTEGEKDKLTANVQEKIEVPGHDKYYSILKLLTLLPGDVTDFGGDKISTSGFETKTKNYHQQNRNNIHWEWLNDPNRKYVKTMYDNANTILGLRDKDELSALNDGVPVSLPYDDKKSVFYPLLRYNDKGSTVIGLFNAAGFSTDNTKKMDRKNVSVDKIELSQSDNVREGLPGGLKAGTKFKNANPGDSSTYVVAIEDGKYVLKNAQAGKQITMKPEDYNAMLLYKV